MTARDLPTIRQCPVCGHPLDRYGDCRACAEDDWQDEWARGHGARTMDFYLDDPRRS